MRKTSEQLERRPSVSGGVSVPDSKGTVQEGTDEFKNFQERTQFGSKKPNTRALGEGSEQKISRKGKNRAVREKYCFFLILAAKGSGDGKLQDLVAWEKQCDNWVEGLVSCHTSKILRAEAGRRDSARLGGGDGCHLSKPYAL